MQKLVFWLMVIAATLSLCDIAVLAEIPPHFLTLPFSDTKIKIQQGWIYTFDPNPNAHKGIDYVKGTIDQSNTWQSFDIIAAADGVAMQSSQPGKGYGTFVYIRHEEVDENGKNYFTIYAHLDSVESKIILKDRSDTNYNTWTPVKRGEVVGQAGDTGSTTGWVHLHFGLERSGYTQNKTDPYDLYANRKYYPGGSEYTGCGINHVWTTDFPSFPPSTDWPFYQRDLQNTGNNPDAATILNPKQDRSLIIEGVSSYAQPVVDEDIIYLASQDGKVYPIDMQRGVCLLPFDTGAEEIKVTPCLSNNKLYVLDSNNTLWVLNKKTLEVLGNCETGLDYYWQTSPQVWKNYILFTVGPYVFRVKDTTVNPSIQSIDSRRFISTKSEMYNFMATSAIKDGIIYSFNSACQVFAFDIESQNFDLLWHWLQFPAPQNPGNLKYLGNPKAVVLAGDILILKNNWRYDFTDPYPRENETGFFYGIDINTHNRILWAREFGLGSSSTVVKDNAIYPVGLFWKNYAIESTVYCLDPRTGSLLFDHGIRTNDDVELSIGGENMYLACWNFKKVFAVNFDPFEIRWQKHVPGFPFSAVVPVGNKVYLSLLDSQVIQSRERLLSLRSSPSHKITSSPNNNIIITSFSENYSEPGDVSGNGFVSGYDGALILQHIDGIITLTYEQQQTADVNHNGIVDHFDAMLIIDYVVGNIVSLP